MRQLKRKLSFLIVQYKLQVKFYEQELLSIITLRHFHSINFRFPLTAELRGS